MLFVVAVEARRMIEDWLDEEISIFTAMYLSVMWIVSTALVLFLSAIPASVLWDVFSKEVAVLVYLSVVGLVTMGSIMLWMKVMRTVTIPTRQEYHRLKYGEYADSFD